MTSLEITGAIEGFLAEVADETALMQMLAQLSTSEEVIAARLGAVVVAAQGNELNQRYAEVRDACRNATDGIRKFRASLVIKEVVRVEQAIEKFYGGMDTVASKLLKEYTDRVHRFRDTYDALVANYDYAALIPFLQTAQSLSAATVTSRSVLRMVRDNLLPEVPVLAEGDEAMSFHFEGPVAYADLLDKLAALRELYHDLCSVTNTDRDEHPLQLVHLETGSLDLQVAEGGHWSLLTDSWDGDAWNGD